MKQILLILMAVFSLQNTSSQVMGDKIIINTTNGAKTEYNLTGDNNALASLKHRAEGLVDVYVKGLEDFGPWETQDVNNVSNIIFNVQRETDLNQIKLADIAAFNKTKQLYKYLKMVDGSKTVSSVMANVDWNHTVADKINATTGKYPAMNCYDFIHIPFSTTGGWIDYNNITPVTEWEDAGGLVSLMWHFNVPKTEADANVQDYLGHVAFYSQDTQFSPSQALINGTWEHKWFYDQMDRVINVILKLQDAGVVALWRPFHEAAGNALRTKGDWAGTAWFWWGTEGGDVFKGLWTAMFNYFQSKNVHNLIWVWTTQNYNGDPSAFNNDADWYPGDQYVDIIGRDLYGIPAVQQQTEYLQLKSRYPGKMITLSECGQNAGVPTADIQDGWNVGAKWTYFMPWYGESLPSDSWWNKVMKESCVITRDQTNMQASFIEESATEAVFNMGLGWNLGNTLDANGIGKGFTPDVYETCWGQPVTTPSTMTFLKKEGFGSVRIPVTWYEHMDENGMVDKAWMDRVQEIVDYAIDAGLYCILNVHHDTAAGKGAWIKADKDNYAANSSKFKSLWTQIANRFMNYDQHLLFESYNEMLDANNTWNAPKDPSSYQYVNAYAQDFVDAVRLTGGNNLDRNLIVNTYAGAHGEAVLDGLKIPNDNVKNHIAVEVHSYDPYNWLKTYGQWNTTCSNEIKNMFNLLNTKYVNQGIPVILGEYGTHGEISVSSSSSDALKQAAADQASDIIKQAKTYGIATFYWMSIFDGNDRIVPQWTLPNVVDAMKNAYYQ
ncbi:MAG: cellulase family glycosylhydrolase [Prevotella sp.]